ncbi:MAG: efflux RND transporter periplasmic adaptor subunit [Pseudomonadota bacterium]
MEPMAMWKQLVLAAALTALGWLGWQERDTILTAAGLAPPAEETVAPRALAAGVPVIVAAVEEAADDLVLEIVGSGRAQRTVVLRSRGAGEIVDLALAANREFAAGNIVMRLEDRDERLAVSLAETRLADAERTRSRFQQLSISGTATASRLDEVVLAAEIAALELARAREALDDRTLRAPFDGVSGLPAVDGGAYVEESAEIARYDDRSVILVEVDVPEIALPRIRLGLAVSATTPSVPGQRFEGTVEAIDSQVDASNRTARLRVAIPNADDTLRPGASFTVRLALPGETYPTVPELAVQFSRGTVHVWRVAEGKAERVEVEMVARRDGRVLVNGPLSPDDRVIVEGTQRLRPGRAVAVQQDTGGDT